MALMMNNKPRVSPGNISGAAGEGSSVSKADAKPTRRSARGSDVVKQEKQAKKARRVEQKKADEARAADVKASKFSRAGRSAGKPAAGKGARNRGSHGAASDSASQRAFLKYANDNAIVRWFYQLTTGPQGKLFYLAVAAFIALGIYLPVRDFYIANRTAQILQEQKAIRDRYNESVGEEVKTYLSQEGIQDTARKDLDMVMPGEQTIDVEGLDEDGNPVVVQEGTDGGSTDASAGDSTGDASASDTSDSSASDGSTSDSSDEDSGMLKGADAADKSKTGTDSQTYDSSKEPTTSAEVEAAEKAVFENSAWYWKVLDVLFFFDGVNGMAVVSTGE